MADVSRVSELLGASPVPLDETLLTISALDPNRSVDIERAMGELDKLAARVTDPTLDGVRRLLFRDLGFDGDRINYHDSRNSMLDEVLARRVGMPITLAAVMIEVGRRVGVPLAGVGMPGHFLIRDRVLTEVFVDPFRGGAELNADDCQRIFHEIHGDAQPFDESYLDPTPTELIITRVLNNLTATLAQRDPASLDWVLDIRLDLPPALTDSTERQALAAMLVRRGRFDAAANVVEQLGDAATATQYRARLN